MSQDKDKVIKESKWTKEDIAQRFIFCYKTFIHQQIRNIKSASIVNVDKINEGKYSPLMHLHSQEAHIDDPLGMGILSNTMPIVIGESRNYSSLSPKKDDRFILHSIVSQFINCSNLEATIKESLSQFFLMQFAEANCLHKDASEYFYSLVNFISSNLEDNVDISPHYTFDQDSIIIPILKKSNKQTLQNAVIDKEIVDKLNIAKNLLESYISENFEDQMEPDIQYDIEIRKSSLEDFVLFGYCGYKKVVQGTTNRLINIPTSKFMYLKNHYHKISFLVSAEFDYNTIFSDIKKRVSNFDIYIYNEDTFDYDYFTCQHTGDLKDFLQFKDKVKIEYQDTIKNLPIQIKTNDKTHLYGNPKTANYFDDALKCKLVEFNIEYNNLVNLFPPIGADATAFRNATAMNEGSNSISDNPISAINTPGQVLNMNTQSDGVNTPINSLAAIIPSATPNTGQLLERYLMYLQKKMSTIFHNIELMSFDQKVGGNMLNYNTMIKKIMTNLRPEYDMYKALLDASINISLHRNIIEEIEKCSLSLDSRIIYSDKASLIFLNHLYSKLSNDAGNYDLIVMWCLYLILTNDTESALYHNIMLTDNIDDEVTSSKALYKLFKKIKKMDDCCIFLSVTNNTEFTTEAAKELLSDIGAVGQLMAQIGANPVALFNEKQLTEYLRNTPLGKYINSNKEIDRVTKEMQQAQQQEQDLKNQALEVQKSKNNNG